MKEERVFSKFDKLPKFKNENLVASAFLNGISKQHSQNTPVYVAGAFVGKPLSRGNAKVHKNTGIFSLFAGSTCLNCKDCINSCYACREQRYNNVYNKRLAYTHLAATNLDFLALLLDAQIRYEKNHGMDFVRIHESGDFFSQDYIDMWTDIAEIHKDVRFYYFTKVDNIFDFSNLKLKNVNRVNSILPDGSINYGAKEYIIEKAKKFNIPICPFKKELNNGCGKCTLCAFNSHVLIEEH